MDTETDKKGYYNVEQLKIDGCKFMGHGGPLLNLIRTGTDESTMGPDCSFMNNTINQCYAAKDIPLLNFYGVQLTRIENNNFVNANPDRLLIRYEDRVRARHQLIHNRFLSAGSIQQNKYVEESKNIFK